jgi:hypothetical protein
MDKQNAFLLCLKIIVIIGIPILLIYIIKMIKGEHDAKRHESYLPKFDNELQEKYYYDVYETVTTNSKAYNERNIFLSTKFLLIIMIIVLALLTFLYQYTDSTVLLYLVIILGVIVIYVIFSNKPRVIYSDIIPKLLTKVNNTLIYQSSSGIKKEIYDASYSTNYDRYYSSDLITGDISNCEFNMSEIRLDKAFKDQNNQVYYETLFNGVVVIVDLSKIRNESTNNEVIVINNNPTDEYDAKILNNKLYVKFYIGSLFTISYSSEKEESLKLANNLCNIDYMLKTIEEIIDSISK